MKDEAKKNRYDEQKWPECDDCFKYKLVGINVHSGSADGGHYWSYINTNRGGVNQEEQQGWRDTVNDPWMEFNDHRVTECNFGEMRQRCYGQSDSGNQRQGTSAYMLFYERV